MRSTSNSDLKERKSPSKRQKETKLTREEIFEKLGFDKIKKTAGEATTYTLKNIKKRDKSTKNRSKTLNKIKEKSLGAFEEFIGAIRKGTQYGKTNIDMLAELAKMKELGILTDEEFQSKKKEILHRI